MPSQNIKSVLDSKPLQFTLQTGGGKWQCTLHSDRSAYEKTKQTAPVVASTTTAAAAPPTTPLPTLSINRTDSDLSVASSSTSASSSSSSSH